MHIYRISREYYANFCDHQREELLSEFELDTNGDILIPYEHKGYTCNDLKVESSHGIKAVSMFSGAGGLDIGTQLAGVPVLTSLDIFEDSVRTIQQVGNAVPSDMAYVIASAIKEAYFNGR